MTKKEKQEQWLILCDYVKKEILQYPDNMKFPRSLALRLRGLEKGQFMANKKQKPMAEYDCKTILYTFKICRPKILQYMSKTEFQSEDHKVNGIMIFVENEINDVVMRLQKVQKSQEKVETMNFENIESNGAEYKKKTKESRLKNLENLW